MDFYADGHHIAGPFTTEPYTCQWTPRVHLDVADYYLNAFGPRVVKAVASDLHGRTGEVTCTVQHVPALVRPVLEDVTKWADLDPDTGPLEILDWLGGAFTYDQHKGGTDFASPFGVDVVAARDGGVEQVCNDWQDSVTTTDPSVGNFVAIRYAVDANLVYYTIYAHLRHTETPIVEGDTVVVGDVIGQADHTGRSTAPHLHLEVRMGSMEAENYVCPYANGLIEGPATQAQ